MKKVLIAAAITSAMLMPLPASAAGSMFGALGDAVIKGKNMFRGAIPTEASALEADGANFRYYEWIAPRNPRVICWGAAGTDKGFGGCYKRLPSDK